MNKPYKLAIVSGTIFSNNMGCNALTYGLLEILSKVAKKLSIDFEYYLVGNPSNGVIPVELSSQKIHLFESLPDFSARGMLRGIFRHTLKKQLCQKRVFEGADIFLYNGWGDSFSDTYGLTRFNEVMCQMKFGLNTGKPLILLPQTIGPFRDSSLNHRVKLVLESAAAIYARDPLSAECARGLCSGIDVFKTIDVAMFMQHTKRNKDNASVRVIGINPSGLLWKGGYTRNNQFGLKDDYQAVIRNLVEFLLSIGGVSVELIGHDIRGPNAGNGEDDYYICKLIQREFPRCKVAPFFYGPIEAKSYISGLDLLIGSRMHCCIAAYSSGVPIFPLAYSRKFKSLFVEELRYPYQSELTEENGDKVIAGVRNVLARLDNIKDEMPSRMQIIERYKEAFIDNLSGKIEQCLTRCV